MFGTRKARLIAAGAITAFAVAAGGGVAYAHPVGDPSPSPTQLGVGHNKHVRAQQWDFDVQRSAIEGIDVNNVFGVGAIPMSLWRNDSLTPFIDRFSRGGNSVVLWHDRLATPDLNVRTCTATFSQDSPFRIIAGTGTGAGLRSRNGELVLQGLVSLPRIPVIKHYHRVLVCPLALPFVTPDRVLRAVIRFRLAGDTGTILGVDPSFADFAVQGSAQVFRITPRVPHPYVTPSVTETAAA